MTLNLLQNYVEHTIDAELPIMVICHICFIPEVIRGGTTVCNGCLYSGLMSTLELGLRPGLFLFLGLVCQTCFGPPLTDRLTQLPLQLMSINECIIFILFVAMRAKLMQEKFNLHTNFLFC